MIFVKVGGSTKKTEAFLKAMGKLSDVVFDALHTGGKQGVNALANTTPTDTGKTAHSWNYKVGQKNGTIFIVWTNSDIESGFPVAIMLQYGYATGTGGYVQGEDYINPSLKPIFDQIRDRVWKAVTSA
jgi:hypothetical protein